jgi:hypothetical protein
MIFLTKNEQHITFLVTLQLSHNRINNTLQPGHNRIYSFIHLYSSQSIYTHDGKSLYTLHYLSIRSISTHFIHLFESIKKGFARTVPQCGGGRAAAMAEEEASVNGSSGA